MYSRNRGLFRVLSISFVVLTGWLALFSTGTGGNLERTTFASPAQGPGADILPSWIISPTAPSNPILIPRPRPPQIQYTTPFTYSLTPDQPWDTEYIRVGSVFQDPASKTYRMYYESNSVILYTVDGSTVQIPYPSRVGVAFSSDGINWSRPTAYPIFGPGPAGSWDSAYVGSPRVVYDGGRFLMFYVGSNVIGPNSGNNYHFTYDAPAYIGVAQSYDGINWDRAGRTTPVFTTTVGAWDSWYAEPAGARIQSGKLYLYYTSANASDPGNYRTGLATLDNVINTPLTSMTLTRVSTSPLKVNGSDIRIKSAVTQVVNGLLFLWYVNNASGSDLIYQAYSNGDLLNFTRDPDGSIIKPINNSPNDLVSQVDIGAVLVGGTSDYRTATMWFTGRSSTDLYTNGFRAIAPNQNPPPLGANTPIPLPTRVVAPTPTPANPNGGIPGYPNPQPGGSGGIQPPGPIVFQTPTPGDGNYPPFYDLWRRVDLPVQQGFAQRSWIYGPVSNGFRYLRERYEEGSRIVLYHDKARMEATADGGVTNGLLAKELISGQMQVGDNKFEGRRPAAEAIAGDALEVNPNNPSYASLSNVASLYLDKRSPARGGAVVFETLDRYGNVGSDGAVGNYGVTYSYYEPILGHNIANVFYNFFIQRGVVLNGNGYTNSAIFDWVSTVGLPLTEPYWTKAIVGGQQKDVLVQAFERRVLTYTPSNNDPFKVEMGNVGRHYFRWRYGVNP